MACLTLVGCASPGPPRAPSLQLPESVRNLSASRQGDTITVHFTLPQRTTDNLLIREGAVKASLCLGLEGSPCVVLPSRNSLILKLTPGESVADRQVTWTDNLPATDVTGEPRLLVLRVQLSNLGGKTVGWCDPAYTATGAAPQPIDGLQAQETPTGILLRWQPSVGPTEVILRREDLSPAKQKSDESTPVWLATHSDTSGDHANQTLDTSAAEDVRYRYTAVRRESLQVGQQTVELRSAASPPVDITWRNQFPPPTPTGLSAAPFMENGGFAVDLVWEPVEEPGLKGYVVTRTANDGAPEQLTPEPVGLPAFHDTTAKPGIRYSYDVQAVGHKGIHSPSASVTVEPSGP